MASPQLEKGHTRVANEILNEIMKMNLNGTQFRLVLAVWRYTYGFQRKSYGLSTGYLAKLIDASRGQVERELKKLIDMNIISVNGLDEKGARILSFQKNYKEWGEQEKVVSPPKENKPKKQPNKKQKYSEDNTYYKMALYFYGLVSKVAAEAGVEHLIRKANLQSWADDFRKLVELDGVDKRQAKEVMDWVTQDPFWKTNVLSARKLREKFAELAIKMKADKSKMYSFQVPKIQHNYDTRNKEIEFQRWLAEGKDPDEFKW